MSCHICLVVCLPGYDEEGKLDIMKSLVFFLVSRNIAQMEQLMLKVNMKEE